jgi:hyaluronate lyase
MSSSRIGNFESISTENLRGWYTADGMTYLYNSDLLQYNDGFWPTVNSYRLPGTTVDTPVRAEGSGAGYLSPNNWVGGAALGDWGAAGMQLDAWNSSLVAKKSWFMFDDEIVCLGAGITSTDNRTIETIVENRMLQGAGTNPLTVNGVAQPATLGWSAVLAGTSWAHLAGNVAGADIGYYFPQAVTVRALREARSASWDDIVRAVPGSLATECGGAASSSPERPLHLDLHPPQARRRPELCGRGFNQSRFVGREPDAVGPGGGGGNRHNTNH